MTTDTFPKVGDRVRVVGGVSDTEKHLAHHTERVYVVLRYTNPHGMAVIQEVSPTTPDPKSAFPFGAVGQWWVHPEALERAK